MARRQHYGHGNSAESLQWRGLCDSPGGENKRTAVLKRSDRIESHKYRRNAQRACCGARCKGEAIGVRSVLVRVWGDGDFTEGGNHATAADFALRCNKICRRTVCASIRKGVWAGKRMRSVLQRFWSASGPHVAIFRGAVSIHAGDSRRPTAGRLRRRRTVTRFYLH